MTPGVLLAGWHAVWKLGLILPDGVECWMLAIREQ